MKYYFVYFSYSNEKDRNGSISFHYVKTDNRFNIITGRIDEIESKRKIESVINKLNKNNIKIICFDKENLFPFLDFCNKKNFDYSDFEVIEYKILYSLFNGQLKSNIDLQDIEKKYYGSNNFQFYNRANLLLELYKTIHTQNDIVLSEYEHNIYSCALFTISKYNSYDEEEEQSIILEGLNLNAKKFLFFDIECSNCFGNKGKICEFSYVITNRNFEIIEKKEITINPGPKGSGFDFHLVDKKTNEGIHLLYEQDDYKVYRESPSFDFYMDEIKRLMTSKDYIKFGYAVSNDIRFLKYSFARYKLPIEEFCCYDVYSLLKKIVPFEVRGLEKTSQILVENKELSNLPMHSSLADSIRTMVCLKNALKDIEIINLLKKNIDCICTSSFRNMNEQAFNSSDFIDQLKIYKETMRKRKEYIKFRNLYLENKNIENQINKTCYKNKKFILSSKLKNDKDLALKIIKNLISKDYLLVFDENDADIYIFLDETDLEINTPYFNKKYHILFSKDINRIVNLYEDGVTSKTLIKAVELEREVELLYKENKYREAFPIYLKLAKMGFVKYQRRMGEIYKDGVGIRKKLEKAKYWYELSSKKGDKNATYNLALLYLEEGNCSIGKKLLENVGYRGYKAALESLGDFYTQGKYNFNMSFKKAEFWYSKLLEVNASKGYLRLAHLYANDKFEEYSLEKAYKYYELSALKNDPDANFILGKEYYEGNYYTQDMDNAVKHFKFASSKGIKKANYFLGKIYFKDKKYDQAIECFIKVDDLDYEDICLYLARMYENGWGVDKNIKTALKYYILNSDK